MYINNHFTHSIIAPGYSSHLPEPRIYIVLYKSLPVHTNFLFIFWGEIKNIQFKMKLFDKFYIISKRTLIQRSGFHILLETEIIHLNISWFSCLFLDSVWHCIIDYLKQCILHFISVPIIEINYRVIDPNYTEVSLYKLWF